MNAENRVEVLKKIFVSANVAKKFRGNREKTAFFEPRYLRNGATERRHFALVGKRISSSLNLPLRHLLHSEASAQKANDSRPFRGLRLATAVTWPIGASPLVSLALRVFCYRAATPAASLGARCSSVCAVYSSQKLTSDIARDSRV